MSNANLENSENEREMVTNKFAVAIRMAASFLFYPMLPILTWAGYFLSFISVSILPSKENKKRKEKAIKKNIQIVE